MDALFVHVAINCRVLLERYVYSTGDLICSVIGGRSWKSSSSDERRSSGVGDWAGCTSIATRTSLSPDRAGGDCCCSSRSLIASRPSLLLWNAASASDMHDSNGSGSDTLADWHRMLEADAVALAEP